jgi:UDPglucose 6-dehydrogenase
MGYDLDPSRMSLRPQPYQEAGPDGSGDFNDELAGSSIEFGSLSQVVMHADILFLMVQTPHEPQYEGITPMPEGRADFGYHYLREAVRGVVEVLRANERKALLLAIVSTVLPGTTEREVVPLLEPVRERVRLAYNPSFIAMGTAMRDFLYPEFVLIGQDSALAGDQLRRFYSGLVDASTIQVSIPSAELAKVVYNTAIGLKIVLANTVMEICDAIAGADCDQVMGVVKKANKRIISTAYLDGGMGDGGGCHPRDNIAMSWLARELGLSFDIFEAVMQCREWQCRYLLEMAITTHTTYNLPIVILGYAFKPDSNLTVGSPALLLAQMFREHSVPCYCVDDDVDPTSAEEKHVTGKPGVFIIGCRHIRYQETKFAPGSYVIDPHRMIADQKGVTVYRLGEKARG